MMSYLAKHNSPAVVQTMRVTLTLGALGRWLVCRLRARRDAARGFAAYNRGLWRGAPQMN
jgi:hypothetical protein